MRDAVHPLGKWTAETERAIREEVGFKDAATVSIGLGLGENLVKYAAVIHTARRAAGRTVHAFIFMSTGQPSIFHHNR